METNSFEEAIVVEATLSNQLKRHTVKLTKTYKLEDTEPAIINDAHVYISDDAGNSYDFSFEDGLYISDHAFQAVEGRAYTLNLSTADGKTYKSSPESLTGTIPIESVTANEVTKDGKRGVQISVNSYDPSGNSKFYRYEYEETYKVVAPYWSENIATIVLDNEQGMSLNDVIVITPRTYEARTCYSTNKSTYLNITNTVNLSEDRVDNYPVRFISVDDPIIRNRYSIKVLQYVQSLSAYTFYETLKELSTTGENILAQNQPGYFYGNMRSISNEKEKVLGFFEVSSVSEHRIFFNFNDIFPNDQPPPYLYECEVFTYDSTLFELFNNQGSYIRTYILQNQGIYYEHDFPFYSVVKPECGDCTSFSSNIVPEFWE